VASQRLARRHRAPHRSSSPGGLHLLPHRPAAGCVGSGLSLGLSHPWTAGGDAGHPRRLPRPVLRAKRALGCATGAHLAPGLPTLPVPHRGVPVAGAWASCAGAAAMGWWWPHPGCSPGCGWRGCRLSSGRGWWCRHSAQWCVQGRQPGVRGAWPPTPCHVIRLQCCGKCAEVDQWGRRCVCVPVLCVCVAWPCRVCLLCVCVFPLFSVCIHLSWVGDTRPC
jgi:hypothetical protein